MTDMKPFIMSSIESITATTTTITSPSFLIPISLPFQFLFVCPVNTRKNEQYLYRKWSNEVHTTGGRAPGVVGGGTSAISGEEREVEGFELVR
jgi:hypothetical protein